MRVILITSKLRFEDDGSPIGGSVIDLHLKARGLVELGYEVTVVTAFSNANCMTVALPYRVEERLIGNRGLLSLQRGIYAFLKEFESKTDVFYIDGHMFLYGAGLYRLCGGRVPIVGFFNIRLNAWADTSGDTARPPLYRRIRKTLRHALERLVGAPIANRLDAFIFNTPQVQTLYHRFGIGRGKPNALIPDFVATRALMERFGVSRESAGARHRADAKMTLFATGRMLPEKGFDLLLRAFALISRKDNYSLVISGDGPEMGNLKKLAKELGIDRSVIFTGWISREALYGFFKKATLFIFPRWWLEYGSVALTEAMAFGLPATVPGGGALEWLAGGAALAFKNGDGRALAERIEELATNAQLRKELSEKSVARAEELDARVLTRRLEELLVSVRNTD